MPPGQMVRPCFCPPRLTRHTHASRRELDRRCVKSRCPVQSCRRAVHERSPHGNPWNQHQPHPWHRSLVRPSVSVAPSRAHSPPAVSVTHSPTQTHTQTPATHPRDPAPLFHPPGPTLAADHTPHDLFVLVHHHHPLACASGTAPIGRPWLQLGQGIGKRTCGQPEHPALHCDREIRPP
jgi:hypothetical protein